ncbi:MAG: hypothetical protein ACLTLQ_21915 [[Clostridium] scindens]
MAKKHTLEELSNCSKEELITLVLMMQGQLEALMRTLKNSLSKYVWQTATDLENTQRHLILLTVSYHSLMKLSVFAISKFPN